MAGPAIPPTLGLRQAMPLDRAAADAATRVQELVEELFPQDETVKQAIADLRTVELATAQAIARVAGTDDGKVTLEWLLDQTLRRPVHVGGPGVDPMQAYAEGRYREGKNAIVHLLLVAIARGRGEQPPFREGT